MSDVLLLRSTTADVLAAVDTPSRDTAAVWPCQAGGATSWAAQLHDDLVARAATASPSPAPRDVARVASWLRVQAVGRETVIVTEPRIGQFAALWSAGAAQAGIQSVRCTPTADAPTEQVPITRSAPAGSDSARAWTPGSGRAHSGWADRCRLWLVDRAEGTARWVVRGLQR